jgi:cobalt-precorrin-5B (C1)-methyltransferase
MNAPDSPPARAGFTLPVFACAAAIAALRHLRQDGVGSTVAVELLEPKQRVEIPIEQVAKLNGQSALGITRSDPGDNLDITRHTPVWAVVSLHRAERAGIRIEGGEGVGTQGQGQGEAAIYGYAKRLIQENLTPWLQPEEEIEVKIVLPEGKRLAQRTSNQAFGVVEGLSLLGTTGISQPLSAPAQLEAYQAELTAKAKEFATLVLCIGENGRDLAQKIGINPQQLVKGANWLGPMLLTAALAGVKNLLLFGYHGKLIKLAGGIFHTHHQMADGRLEILTAYGVQVGLPLPILQGILKCETAEAALQWLREQDQGGWVKGVYEAIALGIETRAQNYIYQNSERAVTVGCMLFGRERSILVTGPNAERIVSACCLGNGSSYNENNP